MTRPVDLMQALQDSLEAAKADRRADTIASPRWAESYATAEVGDWVMFQRSYQRNASWEQAQVEKVGRLYLTVQGERFHRSDGGHHSQYSGHYHILTRAELERRQEDHAASEWLRRHGIQREGIVGARCPWRASEVKAALIEGLRLHPFKTSEYDTPNCGACGLPPSDNRHWSDL